MKAENADPVKLFIGVLLGVDADSDLLAGRLADSYGPIDYMSKSLPFEDTDYYQAEMGRGLLRVFFSFEKLIDPAEIVRIKLETNELEKEFLRNGGGRMVNLDPGYLDTHKVVLASAKAGWQKIYLNSGIWADPTLYYRKGNFHSFDWGFPDFRSGRYNDILLHIRGLFKLSRRSKQV